MKVAILTMFKGLSRTYSLVQIVEQQLQMLLDHSIEVKCLVCEGCKRDSGIYSDSRIEWVEITNHLDGKPIIWRDYSLPKGTLHEGFDKEIEVIAKDFVQALQDVQVCLMHDILFQGWHYVHNIAIRKAATYLKGVRFIEFTHSFPFERPSEISPQMLGRYIGMPNTIFTYPTYSGIPALAEQYHLKEGECKVVHNTLSIISDMDASVKQLQERVALLSTEILIIYPCRMTPSKALEKVAQLVGAIKKESKRSVKIIYCDFPSKDIESKAYKKQILAKGIASGLDEEDIVFTTDNGFQMGFPHQGVLDLFLLSNLFICPSFSESFGLTVLEAASRGNFIVLNENVPALQELKSRLKVYGMGWDARKWKEDYKMEYEKDEESYYLFHAKEIIKRMFKENALLAKTGVRRYYSQEWVWHNQLYPLIKQD